MKYLLKCKNCGKLQLITDLWLDIVSKKYLLNDVLSLENIEKYLHRFKCSRCFKKNVTIISLPDKSENIKHRKKINKYERSKTKKKIKPVDRIISKFSINWRRKPSYHIYPKFEPFPEETDAPGWTKQTCPMCGGDGGPGGRCFKCDGSGWI
jgi:hypothetical protein